MPDIFHTLVNYDLEMLKIIAGKWNIPLKATKQVEIAREMAARILDPIELEMILEGTPGNVRECLSVLKGSSGRMPWGEFLRRYGIIREMGIARRNRETPFEKPASVAEVLWYLGLIGRAFLEGENGLQEYAYIPDELLKLLPKGDRTATDLTGAAVDQKTLRFIHHANDHILDHLTSYLAVIRSGGNPEDLQNEFKRPSLRECEQLLICCGLLDSDNSIHPEAIKSFLAQPRGSSLCFLFTNWSSSTSYNELKLVPSIITEGTWKNDPLKTRQAIIEIIKGMDGAKWWRIDSFIATIKNTMPFFQRPSGDFESWMIRSEKTGDSLRGFEHWDEVDGALIRYLIQGPLHWLGILDLGGERIGARPVAFKLSGMAADLFSNNSPVGVPVENGTITALRNGKLICPRDVPRAVRYQLARFCEVNGVNDKGYLYQISAGSLKNAIAQGLQADQLSTLLIRHARGAMPASLATALQRWAKNGAQASLNHIVLLRVATPEILIEIRNSPVGRFLGEPLNPTTSILPSEAVEKIIPRLLELGYFCEKDDEILLVNTDKG
jgi:hypothetical protein